MNLKEIEILLPEGVSLEDLLPYLTGTPPPLSFSLLEYECTGCNRIYKGKSINSTEPQQRRFVSLCPRCFVPNEKLWWLHHYLDLEAVIEPS